MQGPAEFVWVGHGINDRALPSAIVLVLDRGALCVESHVGSAVSPNGAGAFRNPGQGSFEDKDEDDDEDDRFEASCVSCVCIVKRSGSTSLFLVMIMKRALS
jgi:hypothetical protein